MSFRTRAREMFDNLYHVIRADCDLGTSTETVSAEIDLDLPRGYIAKIKKVIFWLKDWDNFDLGTDHDLDINGVLLNDPDDEETIQMPTQTNEHDVICEFEWGHGLNQDDVNGHAVIAFYYGPTKHIFDYGDKHTVMDVVAARNLRFNTRIQVTGSPNSTPDTFVNVYYTLEEVKSKDMLVLLDIL